MKKLFLTVVLSIISGVACPQWTWQNPLPQGNALKAVCFINSQVGFSVGGWGTILKTWDGGDHWQLIPCPTHCDLNSVWFLNPMNGWITGGMGPVILHTTDGGNTWDIQYTNTGWWMSGVDFTDALHGFAVGPSGGINLLKTSDGGTTWLPHSSQPADELHVIRFVNDSTGWIGGSNGIYKTTDGGETWVKQTSSGARSFCFLNDTLGFAAGTKTILKTVNGGSNWQILQSNTGQALSAICFVNKDTGWVVGGDYSNICWKTTNGGSTWTPETVYPGNLLYGISFLDENTGWIIGSDGLLLKTLNGAAAWIDKRKAATFGDLSRVQFLTATAGYAIGDGIILKTMDGGTTWDTVRSDNTWSFTRMHFIDLQTGWVTAGSHLPPYNGAVFHTTDGGTHWSVQGTASMHALNGCHFINGNVGWVAGKGADYQTGEIYKTTDGGVNWDRQLSDSLGDFTDLSFVDANTGWAVRMQDRLSKTVDGGTTWTTADVGSGQYLYKVLFLNHDTGWVAGWYTVAKTTDGGSSWDWQLSNDVYDLCFINADTGWAVGGYGPGIIFKTIDGGENWTWLDCVTGYVCSGISFTDANNGWVVGPNGTILKTGNGGGFPVGIDHNPTVENLIPEIAVFPNPAREKFKVQSAKCKMQIEEVGLVDMFGKVVAVVKGQTCADGLEFDVSRLPSGVYFCRISTANSMVVKKIVKF